MTNIGILQGGKGKTTYNIIRQILKYTTNLNVSNLDLINYTNSQNKYNILILSENVINFNIHEILCNKAIIVLNIDEKLCYPIKLLNSASIITYGFNSKACITASSVVNGSYNTVQFCIQRSISRLDGQILEPQEFPVKTQNKDILNVLSAVTTVILSGYDISSLNHKFFV